jgi:hypothetical protein
VGAGLRSRRKTVRRAKRACLTPVLHRWDRRLTGVRQAQDKRRAVADAPASALPTATLKTAKPQNESPARSDQDQMNDLAASGEVS